MHLRAYPIFGLLFAAFALAGCGGPEQTQYPGGTTTTVASANAPATANAPASNAPAGNAPAETGAESAGGASPVNATIETTMGDIELELYPDKAPITVENFVSYAKKGHYNGTIFHRVMPGFMIQGGGFTPNMTEKPTDPPIKNEGGNGLQNDRGTIAMARTPDPDSATSQFFINVNDNQPLNRETSADGYGYAVFGKVTRGMDVVDKIVAVPTTSKDGHRDVPVDPITIKSVKVRQ
jgi:cyclophilin family peptidyl-prolyl cis-trans isomerase